MQLLGFLVRKNYSKFTTPYITSLIKQLALFILFLAAITLHSYAETGKSDRNISNMTQKLQISYTFQNGIFAIIYMGSTINLSGYLPPPKEQYFNRLALTLMLITWPPLAIAFNHIISKKRRSIISLLLF